MTVVGGKLTTYRRMAEDAVDAAVAHAGLTAGPCRTRTLPLLGAAPRAVLAAPRGAAPGWCAATAPRPRWCWRAPRDVTGLADDELLAPVADGVPATLAELLFGVTHEGAARRRRPARPAHPGRAGRRPTGRSPSPAAERALSLADPAQLARRV